MIADLRIRKQIKGFTLIEVLVAATIIAILATIGLVSYQAAGRSGRDAKRKSDLEQIRSALEIYKSDNGSYPASVSCSATASLYPNYINPYPTDPKPASSQYCYTQLSTTTYEICASLENGGGAVSCSAGANCIGTCNYRVTNP